MRHPMTVVLAVGLYPSLVFSAEPEQVFGLAAEMIVNSNSTAAAIAFIPSPGFLDVWHERILAPEIFENLGVPQAPTCFHAAGIDFVAQRCILPDGVGVTLLDTQPALMVLVDYDGPPESATSAIISTATTWFGAVTGIGSLSDKGDVRESVRLYATDNIPPGNHGAKDGLVAVICRGRMGIMALKSMPAWTDAQTEPYAFSMETAHWFFPMHRKGP